MKTFVYNKVFISWNVKTWGLVVFSRSSDCHKLSCRVERPSWLWIESLLLCVLQVCPQETALSLSSVFHLLLHTVQTDAGFALCYRPEGRGLRTRWSEWIFSLYLILPFSLGPAVHSACTRSRKIMFLGCKTRPVRRADNLTAISEPIV
jgi:hypothetical protein